MKGLGRQLHDMSLLARDAGRRLRAAPCYDELLSAGRLVRRALPDGGELICCEGWGRAVSGSEDKESREVTVTASDSTENRYGDVDVAQGWKTEHYEKNPVVLINHWYTIESIVGVATRWWVDGEGDQARLMERHRFDPDDLNDTARMLFGKILARSARAVSTSFLPLAAEKVKKDGEWTGQYRFLEMEKLETSWVAVPANRNAVRLDSAPDADGDARASVARDLEEAIVRTWAREHVSRIDRQTR